MKIFRTFCGFSVEEMELPDSLTEGININPAVAKAAAGGILFKIKQSAQKVEGADAKILANQLFLSKSWPRFVPASGHLQQAKQYLNGGKYAVQGAGCAGRHTGQ
jgi:hypothetical protein